MKYIHLKSQTFTETEYNYIYLSQFDGIGSMYNSIAVCLKFCKDHELKLLIDPRSWTYFKGEPLDIIALNDIFIFDTDIIIIDPIHITNIIQSNINKILFVKSTQSKRVLPRTVNYNLPIEKPVKFVNFEEFYKICVLSQPTDYTLSEEIPIKLGAKFQNIFDQYKDICKETTGVHARLGNGELTYMRRSKKPRVYIDQLKFITEMHKHHDQFFICTDTHKFIKKATFIFGNRVVSIPRKFAPSGLGPGHRASQYHDRDMYNHLGYAITEMLLLGECKSLLYNISNFTFYARHFRQVKSALIV